MTGAECAPLDVLDSPGDLCGGPQRSPVRQRLMRAVQGCVCTSLHKALHIVNLIKRPAGSFYYMRAIHEPSLNVTALEMKGHRVPRAMANHCQKHFNVFITKSTSGKTAETSAKDAERAASPWKCTS